MVDGGGVHAGDIFEDVARYAHVIAHLRHFPADQHAEVFERLGIAQADWTAAGEKWRGVWNAERATGQLDVTVRFGQAVAHEYARLQAERPSIESLGPLSPSRGDEAPAPAAAVEGSAPGLTRTGAEEKHAASSPQAEAPPAGGASDGSSVPTYLLSKPAATPAGAKRTATTAAMARVEGPPLPFVEGRSPLASAGHRPAPTSVDTGTAEADYGGVVAAVQARTLSGGFQLGQHPAPRAPAGQPTRRDLRVGSGTGDIDFQAIAAMAQRGLLPFASAAPAHVAPVQAAPAGAAPTEAQASEPLSLETYAAITGALARGEPREHVLSRHGVTAEAFDEQARAWSRRSQNEPELVARFKELVRRAT
jgi:hypothetical protein